MIGQMERGSWLNLPPIFHYMYMYMTVPVKGGGRGGGMLATKFQMFPL